MVSVSNSSDDDNDNDYNNNNNNNNNNNIPCCTAHPDIPNSSEFTPHESFWLSKDSEYNWFDRLDRNAFLERKESTKGNSNSNTSSYSRSNSQKFSVNVKSKPAIIGLPKSQKNTHVDSNRRNCKPANVRLFPKRSGSAGRASSGTGLVTEPSSPKVSCIGRVRSKRCSTRRRVAAPPSQQPVCKKTGLISRIASLFGNNRRKSKSKSSVKVNEQLENSYSRKNTVKPVNSEPDTPPEPPVLGGMNRFASGRRSEKWSDEIDSTGCRRPS